MSYLKLYLLFLITFSFGAKAQNNSAIVNDVLISKSNNIIWISDNIHSDVRGVSMINGKEVVFLPHKNYVAKIYETDKHLITVNDFVRFWDKEDYSLQDSIALDNFYLNAQIPKENTLTNITLSSLQLVDLKTKNIKNISLPNHELTNAKVKINSSGRIFFIKPNSVLELINEKVTEIYKSKEFIKGSIINDQGIHLLLSPELFRTDIKTSIKHINFEGKELSHIYIDNIPHLKIGLGELNSYNTSDRPYFNIFGSSYLLQTTSGLVALSNSWKQYLISGFYDLPYSNVNYKNFNGQFVRTDGGKVTVFDLWGSILYQENIESLYSTFNITNQDKMSLLNTLYLIGVDGERTNKQEFTWNNYILPVNISNKDNFLTFHKNGEVNVWNYSNFNKEYKWEISGNKRPLFATFQIDKTHILTLFPDSKKIVVYDLNGKIINQQNYDIEDFITAISSTNEGVFIGTSSGDVHQLDDKLKIISSHKDVFGEAVSSITFLEKSKELILGSRGRLIRCPLSIGKISPEQVTKVHNGYITDLSTQHFSGHDFLLTNSFFDNSCFLWDLKNKSLVKSYKQEKNIQYAQLIDSLNVPMTVDSIGFTFDSNLDLVKKLESDKPEVYLQASVTSPIRKISFSKDQNLILVLSQNIVYILDVKTRKVITQIEVTDDNINDAILDDNSREVIITQGDNLKSYDIASGKIIREIKYDHVGNFSVHRLRKVPATPFILGINTHGWTNPFVIHENSGKVITRYGIPLDGNRIYDIQFSKSGQFMAVYTNKEVVVYKDYLTNKPIKVFKYDRKSEVSYTTMNIVHIDEDQNLLMFVAKVEGRTCTLIYDYIEQKLIKNIKYNYLADIVGNSIVYGHMDGIKQVSLEDDSKSFFNAKKDFMSDLSAIAYNEKYDLVIGGDIWGNIKLFDNKSKNELAAIDRFQNDIYNFKKYKNHFIYNHKEGLFIIDNKKFENKLIENASNYPFYADLSEDETHIIYLESSSSKDKPFVYVENLKTGISTKLFQLPVTSNNLSVFTLSENHIIYSYKIDNMTYFASYDIENNSNEILIETEKNLVLDNQSTTKNLYYVEILNDDNKKILTTKTYDYQLIDKKKNLLHTVEYHLDDHKDINTRNLQKYLKNFQLISASGYQVYQTEDGINIFDYRSKKYLLKEFDQVKNKLFKYHVASNTLYIISEENDVISYNLTTKTLNTLFTINSNIEQIDLVENELIILSSDEKIKVYSTDGQSIEYQIQSSGEDGISIINNNGYYMTSKNAVDNIVFKKGLNVYPFDQFDAWFNRPDIVLKDIEGTDKEYINQAYLAYKKRLNKLSLDNDFPKIDGLPKVIINKENIPVTINQKEFTFSLAAQTSDQSKISSIDVWINNVPVFGKNGYRLSSNTSKIEEDITVALNDGINKIEVGVRTDLNSSSLKEEFFITCEQNTSSKFYVIGIGISHYKDSTMNLQYADKDAKDIVNDLKKKGNHIEAILLTNEQVTKKNILALKEQLLKTNVDDEILLYYAGHGMLDYNYDYYLTTHDINFRQPKELGLKYDDFINLLDGIPARKKLVIIDACHSGELDETPTNTFNTNNNVKVVSSFTRGLVPELPIPTASSFEFMQDIFTDLRRDTGATIISSAGGNEFAYEGEGYDNGLFTYFLRKAISEDLADSNSDDKVSVQELLDYLEREVKEASNGQQQPNARRINKEENFKLWNLLDQ